MINADNSAFAKAKACGSDSHSTVTNILDFPVKPTMRASVAEGFSVQSPIPKPFSLKAITSLSDDVGILQNSIFSVPDRRQGYSIDDNARALMLMNCTGLQYADEADRLATVYASFIQHAWNSETRQFRNSTGFDRDWPESEQSESSNGMTLWALGYTAAYGRTSTIRRWAKMLFNHSASIALEFDNHRALAFAALGALRVLDVEPEHFIALRIIRKAVNHLKSQFTAHQLGDWHWFENFLANDNCRLPEVLLRAGMHLGDKEAVDCGLRSLSWITSFQTTPEGIFRPIGSKGSEIPFSHTLPFDQQPVEAWAAIDAADAAFDATGDLCWLYEADRAYQWFFGQNDRRVSVANAHSGTCKGGISPRGVIESEAAESILALHLANYKYRLLLSKTNTGQSGISAVYAVRNISV